jgi:cytochrome P450
MPEAPALQKLKIGGQAFLQAPQPVLARALEGGPLAQTRLFVFGRITAVLSHAGITEMMKDAERFTVDARNAGHKSALGMPFLPRSLKLLAENLLTLDEPHHTRLRRLADAPFRRAAIEGMRPAVGAQCARLLDEMAASSNTDLISGLCRPLPVQVICDLLGLSDARRDRLARVFAGFSGGSTLEIFRAATKIGWMQRELREEFALARTAPRPGLIADLVHAEAEGGRLSEDELLSLVFVLFAAGHETTTHFISSSVWTILTEPGARDAIAAMDADALSVAVDELMRFSGPVQFTKPRYAREDTVFLGHPIKRGKLVMALLAAGNLDPAAFEDPLTLNLARRPNRHLSWGWGPHLCLGMHLAKAECEIALRQILERWPGVEIDGDPAALKWSQRPGVRGLARLPLQLKS